MATYTTLIRDLSGLPDFHTRDEALTNAGGYFMAIDTTMGEAGAWRTQKITLDQVRNFVLKSTADFKSNLTVDTGDLIIGKGSDTNIGIGGNPGVHRLHVHGTASVTHDISAGNKVYGDETIDECFIGNAKSATKLKTARTLYLGGELSGQTDETEKFDGAKSVTIKGYLKDDVLNSRHIADVYPLTTRQPSGSGVYTLPQITLNNKGQVTDVVTGYLAGDIYTTGELVGSDPEKLNTFISPLAIDNTHISEAAGIVDSKLATITSPGKVDNSATTAKTANVGTAIVVRNPVGDFEAGTIKASLQGNADTATGFAEMCTLKFGGSVAGTAKFNGDPNSPPVGMPGPAAPNGQVLGGPIDVELALTSSAVKSDHIGALQVQSSHLAGSSVTNTKIASDQVDGGHLKDGIISTDKIADQAVIESKIGGNAVTSEKIKGANVLNGHLSVDSITTDKIVNDAVTDDKLSHLVAGFTDVGYSNYTWQLSINPQGRVTGYTHMPIILGSDAVVDGSIGTGQLADAGVTGDKIAGDAISSGKIQSGAVTNIKIGNITSYGKIKFSALARPAGTVFPNIGDNNVIALSYKQETLDGTVYGYANTLMLRDGSGNVEINKLTAYDDVIVSSSSDASLKDNVKTLTGSLKKISEIRGVEFDWNSRKQTSYEGHDTGVIAQEVEKVFPEMVVTRDSGIKAVRYDRLIPVLIEAIKELSTEIQQLKNK